MVQIGRGARFTLEPCDDFVRGDEFVLDHLDCDGLVEHDVHRAVDGAHAPGGYEGIDAVLSVEERSKMLIVFSPCHQWRSVAYANPDSRAIRGAARGADRHDVRRPPPSS